MLNIAVVDDEIEQVHLIQHAVMEFFESSNIPFLISSFFSGESLLSSTIQYDLIFLDIQMKGIDGIQTAQKLRERDQKVSLIYISNYSNQMARSFCVHPFSFLEKPIQLEKISHDLNDFLFYFQKEERRNLALLQLQRGQIAVDVSNVLYFEYDENRKIKMITTNSDRYVLGSITGLMNQLEEYGFFSPHKSFLVNMDKVISFQDMIELPKGILIPIAKNRRKQVCEQISQYMHQHLKDNWREQR